MNSTPIAIRRAERLKHYPCSAGPLPCPLLPLDEEEFQTPVESGELRKNPALLWETAAPSYLRQQAQTTGTPRAEKFFPGRLLLQHLVPASIEAQSPRT